MEDVKRPVKIQPVVLIAAVVTGLCLGCWSLVFFPRSTSANISVLAVEPVAAAVNQTVVVSAPPVQVAAKSSAKPPVTIKTKKRPTTLRDVAIVGQRPTRSTGRHEIFVSIDEQRLYARENGRVVNEFVCSTGASGRIVYPGEPDLKDAIHDHVGRFRVLSKERYKFTRTYNTSMNFALRYIGGHFIHATEDVGRLGQPASHGCVRLHPRDAAWLFDWIKIGDPIHIQKEPFVAAP